MVTLLCTAVGTTGHQRRLEICTVCGRFVSLLKNDRAVPNLFALNLTQKTFLSFHLTCLHKFMGK